MAEIRYITEDFLLSSEYARELYHKYAKPLPIVDFHCHLPPQQVAEDYQFANMTDIWLRGDHYKWRLMRANGIPERFCTGAAGDWEKFEKWAETVPYLFRNPAYHWTHLELRKPFGITNCLFGPSTAEAIWKRCNSMLTRPEFSARGIMKQMNVALVCTTDDPTDDLEAHRRTAEDKNFDIQMLPTWRPDKALAIEQTELFNVWLNRLEEVSGVACNTFDALLEALHARAVFFASRGCKSADHGLEEPYAEDFTLEEVRSTFTRARAGKTPATDAVRRYKSALMFELGLLNHEMGWAQQLHLGPIRNTNSRMYAALGPDSGFDSVGDQPMAKSLAKMLDRLDEQDRLTRTVLYTINPAANMMLATMTGNFQDGTVPGKIQFGSGWWFNDQLDGMRKQLETLSQTSLISRFIGMLTDSRSFLSYPRHDYFRRLLCDMFGNDLVRKDLPISMTHIGQMIQNICYYNAISYFGFDLPDNRK